MDTVAGSSDGGGERSQTENLQPVVPDTDASAPVATDTVPVSALGKLYEYATRCPPATADVLLDSLGHLLDGAEMDEATDLLSLAEHVVALEKKIAEQHTALTSMKGQYQVKLSNLRARLEESNARCDGYRAEVANLRKQFASFQLHAVVASEADRQVALSDLQNVFEAEVEAETATRVNALFADLARAVGDGSTSSPHGSPSSRNKGPRLRIVLPPGVILPPGTIVPGGAQACACGRTGGLSAPSPTVTSNGPPSPPSSMSAAAWRAAAGRVMDSPSPHSPGASGAPAAPVELVVPAPHTGGTLQRIGSSAAPPGGKRTPGSTLASFVGSTAATVAAFRSRRSLAEAAVAASGSFAGPQGAARADAVQRTVVGAVNAFIVARAALRSVRAALDVAGVGKVGRNGYTGVLQLSTPAAQQPQTGSRPGTANARGRSDSTPSGHAARSPSVANLYDSPGRRSSNAVSVVSIESGDDDRSPRSGASRGINGTITRAIQRLHNTLRSTLDQAGLAVGDGADEVAAAVDLLTKGFDESCGGSAEHVSACDDFGTFVIGGHVPTVNDGDDYTDFLPASVNRALSSRAPQGPGLGGSMHSTRAGSAAGTRGPATSPSIASLAPAGSAGFGSASPSAAPSVRATPSTSGGIHPDAWGPSAGDIGGGAAPGAAAGTSRRGSADAEPPRGGASSRLMSPPSAVPQRGGAGRDVGGTEAAGGREQSGRGVGARTPSASFGPRGGAAGPRRGSGASDELRPYADADTASVYPPTSGPANESLAARRRREALRQLHSSARTRGAAGAAAATRSVAGSVAGGHASSRGGLSLDSDSDGETYVRPADARSAVSAVRPRGGGSVAGGGLLRPTPLVTKGRFASLLAPSIIDATTVTASDSGGWLPCSVCDYDNVRTNSYCGGCGVRLVPTATPQTGASVLPHSAVAAAGGGGAFSTPDGHAKASAKTQQNLTAMPGRAPEPQGGGRGRGGRGGRGPADSATRTASTLSRVSTGVRPRATSFTGRKAAAPRRSGTREDETSASFRSRGAGAGGDASSVSPERATMWNEDGEAPPHSAAAGVAAVNRGRDRSPSIARYDAAVQCIQQPVAAPVAAPAVPEKVDPIDSCFACNGSGRHVGTALHGSLLQHAILAIRAGYGVMIPRAAEAKQLIADNLPLVTVLKGPASGVSGAATPTMSATSIGRDSEASAATGAGAASAVATEAGAAPQSGAALSGAIMSGATGAVGSAMAAFAIAGKNAAAAAASGEPLRRTASQGSAAAIGADGLSASQDLPRRASRLGLGGETGMISSGVPPFMRVLLAALGAADCAAAGVALPADTVAALRHPLFADAQVPVDSTLTLTAPDVRALLTIAVSTTTAACNAALPTTQAWKPVVTLLSAAVSASAARRRLTYIDAGRLLRNPRSRADTPPARRTSVPFGEPMAAGGPPEGDSATRGDVRTQICERLSNAIEILTCLQDAAVNVNHAAGGRIESRSAIVIPTAAAQLGSAVKRGGNASGPLSRVLKQHATAADEDVYGEYDDDDEEDDADAADGDAPVTLGLARTSASTAVSNGKVHRTNTRLSADTAAATTGPSFVSGANGSGAAPSATTAARPSGSAASVARPLSRGSASPADGPRASGQAPVKPGAGKADTAKADGSGTRPGSIVGNVAGSSQKPVQRVTASRSVSAAVTTATDMAAAASAVDGGEATPPDAVGRSAPTGGSDKVQPSPATAAGATHAAAAAAAAAAATGARSMPRVSTPSTADTTAPVPTGGASAPTPSGNAGRSPQLGSAPSGAQTHHPHIESSSTPPSHTPAAHHVFASPAAALLLDGAVGGAVAPVGATGGHHGPGGAGLGAAAAVDATAARLQTGAATDRSTVEGRGPTGPHGDGGKAAAALPEGAVLPPARDTAGEAAPGAGLGEGCARSIHAADAPTSGRAPPAPPPDTALGTDATMATASIAVDTPAGHTAATAATDPALQRERAVADSAVSGSMRPEASSHVSSSGPAGRRAEEADAGSAGSTGNAGTAGSEVRTPTRQPSAHTRDGAAATPADLASTPHAGPATAPHGPRTPTPHEGEVMAHAASHSAASVPAAAASTESLPRRSSGLSHPRTAHTSVRTLFPPGAPHDHATGGAATVPAALGRSSRRGSVLASQSRRGSVVPPSHGGPPLPAATLAVAGPHMDPAALAAAAEAIAAAATAAEGAAAVATAAAARTSTTALGRRRGGSFVVPSTAGRAVHDDGVVGPAHDGTAGARAGGGGVEPGSDGPNTHTDGSVGAPVVASASGTLEPRFSGLPAGDATALMRDIMSRDGTSRPTSAAVVAADRLDGAAAAAGAGALLAVATALADAEAARRRRARRAAHATRRAARHVERARREAAGIGVDTVSLASSDTPVSTDDDDASTISRSTLQTVSADGSDELSLFEQSVNLGATARARASLSSPLPITVSRPDEPVSPSLATKTTPRSVPDDTAKPAPRSPALLRLHARSTGRAPRGALGGRTDAAIHYLGVAGRRVSVGGGDRDVMPHAVVMGASAAQWAQLTPAGPGLVWGDDSGVGGSAAAAALLPHPHQRTNTRSSPPTPPLDASGGSPRADPQGSTASMPAAAPAPAHGHSVLTSPHAARPGAAGGPASGPPAVSVPSPPRRLRPRDPRAASSRAAVTPSRHMPGASAGVQALEMERDNAASAITPSGQTGASAGAGTAGAAHSRDSTPTRVASPRTAAREARVAQDAFEFATHANLVPLRVDDAALGSIPRDSIGGTAAPRSSGYARPGSGSALADSTAGGEPGLHRGSGSVRSLARTRGGSRPRHSSPRTTRAVSARVATAPPVALGVIGRGAVPSPGGHAHPEDPRWSPAHAATHLRASTVDDPFSISTAVARTAWRAAFHSVLERRTRRLARRMSALRDAADPNDPKGMRHPAPRGAGSSAPPGAMATGLTPSPAAVAAVSTTIRVTPFVPHRATSPHVAVGNIVLDGAAVPPSHAAAGAASAELAAARAAAGADTLPRRSASTRGAGGAAASPAGALSVPGTTPNGDPAGLMVGGACTAMHSVLGAPSPPPAPPVVGVYNALAMELARASARHAIAAERFARLRASLAARRHTIGPAVGLDMGSAAAAAKATAAALYSAAFPRDGTVPQKRERSPSPPREGGGDIVASAPCGRDRSPSPPHAQHVHPRAAVGLHGAPGVYVSAPAGDDDGVTGGVVAQPAVRDLWGAPAGSLGGRLSPLMVTPLTAPGGGSDDPGTLSDGRVGTRAATATVRGAKRTDIGPGAVGTPVVHSMRPRSLLPDKVLLAEITARAAGGAGAQRGPGASPSAQSVPSAAGVMLPQLSPSHGVSAARGSHGRFESATSQARNASHQQPGPIRPTLNDPLRAAQTASFARALDRLVGL